MRKGRGSVDVDIYNELIEVPGARELLLKNTTNFRTDRRTGKLRAEIHEDVWPEVKEMVAKWKRIKKGQPQDGPKAKKTARPNRAKKKKTSVKRKRTATKKAIQKKDKTTSDEQKKIKKLHNLKQGDEFAYKNVGFGLTSYENGGDVLGRQKEKLFTDAFSKMGMDWNGSTWVFDSGLGMKTYIVLLEDVPEGELVE